MGFSLKTCPKICPRLPNCRGCLGWLGCLKMLAMNLWTPTLFLSLFRSRDSSESMMRLPHPWALLFKVQHSRLHRASIQHSCDFQISKAFDVPFVSWSSLSNRDIRWILMGGARRHCRCNLNNKRGENIITVDSALFKFNVAKISNSIFYSKPVGIRHLGEKSVS